MEPMDFTNWERITNDAVDGMPHVSEQVIDAALKTDEKPVAGVAQYPGFDPSIHRSDAKTGAPILKADGSYWPKGGRGKTASKVAAPEPAGPQTADMNAAVAGKLASDMTFTLGVGLGGSEWKPQSNPAIGLDEREYMRLAWTGYFESVGVTDLPPGWVLVVALSLYAVPRFTMPMTQARLKLAFDKYFKRKPIEKEPATDGPHDDIRDDGKRENVTRATFSGPA